MAVDDAYLVIYDEQGDDVAECTRAELWAAIKALEDECQCWTDRGPAVKRLRALLGMDAPAPASERVPRAWMG